MTKVFLRGWLSPVIVIVWCIGLLLTDGACQRHAQADDTNIGPLLVHVVEPISSQMILPDTFPVPGERRSILTFRACRGEFEPASFVLRTPSHDMQGLTLAASDLMGANGTASISSTHIDIKIVKPWFQSYYAWNEIGKSKPDDFRQRLFPELLLKDDSLVRIDASEERNYVRLDRGKNSEYVWVNPRALASSEQVLPSMMEFPVRDAKTLQPFDLTRNANKQVWVTMFVPRDTPPGQYSGHIEVRSNGILLGRITTRLDVYNFELEEPRITHSIYYRAVLNEEKASVGSEFRTSAQIRAELQNLLNHGVRNPTLYQPLSNLDHLSESLRLRQHLGMNAGPLYYLGAQTTATFLGNQAARAEGNLKNILSRISALAQRYGYQSVYIYGKDEAQGADLVAQGRLWDIVHDMKSKVFVAGYGDAFGLVGDRLDLLVHAKQPSAVEAQKWHQSGHLIFNYGNPQTGPENPVLFRLNYGIVLWANGYDGAMPYAYQHCFGSCWNDVDHATYRDHNFTYPTVDGVIDTIAWEGFREGIDDVRYLTTLEKLANDASAHVQIADQSKSFLGRLKATVLEKQASSGKYNQKMDIDLQAVRNQTVLLIDALTKAP